MKAYQRISSSTMICFMAVAVSGMATSAFGQEMHWKPIRRGVLGSPEGTLGTPVSATLEACGWEYVADGGGFEMDLDLRASGWGNAAGAPTLGAIQATIDPSGYNNGVGSDLNPKGWPGNSNGAYQAKNWCNPAFGGNGGPCNTGPFGDCNPGICVFNPDWVMPADADDLPAIATPTLDFAWATGAQNDTNIDDGNVHTMGGLILDVDAGAAGTYVIALDSDTNNTFMTAGDGQPITGVELGTACITIRTGSCCYEIGIGDGMCSDGETTATCDITAQGTGHVFRAGTTCAEENCPECLNDSHCDDNDACTDDSCNIATFICSNTLNYDPNADCCDPGSGALDPIDDDEQCTTDLCDPSTGVVGHTCNSGSCNDGNDCTVDDTCDGVCDPGDPDPGFADRWCAGHDINGDDCTSNADCRAGVCDCDSDIDGDGDTGDCGCFHPGPPMGPCCFPDGTCGFESESCCVQNDGQPVSFCLGDSDGDSIDSVCDNCPNDFNPGQEDGDGDGVGDVCDPCPFEPDDLCPGACCVGATGLCAVPVFAANCQGPLDEWTFDVTCGEVSCPVSIPAGQDCYRMDCAVTEFSFAGDPIPADFFAPGSDPFDGAIRLGGEGSGDPNYDFTIERLDDMEFGQVFPSQRTIDIELVSLNLVNCDPIEVGMPGGETALWNATVGLSTIMPPIGTLTATKEHENGGVFTQTYFIQATYTFSSVDDPNVIRTFDTEQRGVAPIEVETVGLESWVHVADIDGAPCGVAFVPGVVDDGGGRQAGPCCVRIHGAGPKGALGGTTWDCSLCPKGGCCNTEAGDRCVEVVETSPSRSAQNNCELPVSGGGLAGTYLTDGTDCEDTDCDGIPNFMENSIFTCSSGGTNPNNFDSDNDGCGDGDELDADPPTDPNDPCDRPAGACPDPPAAAGCPDPLPDHDCDDDGTSDACDLAGSANDCDMNGIPDKCEPDIPGACCSNTACFEGTTTECAAFQGGIFQGFCTTCPTNLPIATHQGVSIGHFASRPPECLIVTRSAGPEDCSLRTKFYDTWQTDLSGGDQMCHEFGLPGGTPVIPADFFRTGSLAFGGSICLEGEPLGFISIDVPGGPLIEGEFGDADTMVLRSDDPIDRCASTSPIGETVDVQVIALNLTSIGSFTVEFDVGPSEEWIAEVSVSDTAIANLPLGSLTAVKTHCNGGTYNSVLNVLPKFTFIKVDDPNETRVLDFGDPSPAGFDPVQLTQNNNPPWVHEVEGDIPLAADACTEFHPGVEGINVQTVCDCNTNGQRDLCDIETGVRSDCNRNATPDDCDVDPSDPDGNGLVSVDCNSNGVPDECESDCNANGIADACDITAGTSEDVNLNGTPDECEPDCNGNGVPDGHDLSGGLPDCNGNGILDECELRSGVTEDCNENEIPDSCDIAGGASQDCNGDGVPDECELQVPTLAAAPHNILKNRYISVLTNSPNACGYDIRITLTSSLVNGVMGIGSQWWANSPDADCISIVTSTRPGQAPDFSACATLHLSGCPVIPTSNYDIAAVAGEAESTPLAAATQAKPGVRWHGDCVGVFTGPPDNVWTAPQGSVNIDDAFAGIKTFQDINAFNATHVSVTDVAPNLNGEQINRIVNINDVFAILLGFQGQEYPGPDLTQCP